MNSKELADATVKGIRDLVDKKLAPVVTNVSGIAGRLDRHYASIEALERRIAALERRAGPKAAPVIQQGARQMIPPIGVTFCELDSVDVVDDVLSVFLLLSDGSLVAVCLPIGDLIRQAHTIVEGAAAPAFRAGPVLQCFPGRG